MFELFIFSEVLELNRKILIEGNSLLITLIKNFSSDENRFRRINVNKIVLIKDLYNKPIAKITMNLDKIEQIKTLENLNYDGKTEVILNIKDEKKLLTFKLGKNRKIDRNSINLLKKEGIITQIN